MPYNLLIVDGNPQSSAELLQWLSQEYEVTVCKLASQALARLRTKRPDLLLTDLDLPDMEGLTFLSVLRDTEHGTDLPVIVLSAHKTEESVMRAFDFGIEDYVTKPVDPQEIVVRVRTVLRRRFERTEHWGTSISLMGIEIDPNQRRCVVNGKRVALRPREFALLEILMRKSGRVLSRPYLLETIWGMSSSAETRAVDGMISRLRRRLGKRAARMIETVSKMGYSFRSP